MSVKIGLEQETRALRFLEREGLVLLEKNFRRLGGEIDLILKKPDRTRPLIVFVEVRYRTHASFGSALESIHPQKVRRIQQTALLYLQAKGWSEIFSRFDVVALSPSPKIEWIQNAF